MQTPPNFLLLVQAGASIFCAKHATFLAVGIFRFQPLTLVERFPDFCTLPCWIYRILCPHCRFACQRQHWNAVPPTLPKQSDSLGFVAKQCISFAEFRVIPRAELQLAGRSDFRSYGRAVRLTRSLQERSDVLPDIPWLVLVLHLTIIHSLLSIPPSADWFERRLLCTAPSFPVRQYPLSLCRHRSLSV